MEATRETRLELTENLRIPEEEPAAWVAWLQQQAQEHGLLWLLAYQNDGVIWGRVEAGTLIFPSIMNAYPTVTFTAFQPLYLQKLHLFGPGGELLVWRDMDYCLAARLVMDGGVNPDAYIDRTALLWGTEILATQNGFTLLREGEQGFYQAPPLDAAGIQRLPAGLVERHYLFAEPETGQAVIQLSRFVGFRIKNNGGGQ